MAMPRDPLAPFLAQHEQDVVRLEADVDGGDYRRRRGFCRATVLLLESASEAETWQDGDPLVWPALTNFRHFVELTCKMLARDSGELNVIIPAEPTAWISYGRRFGKS